MITNCFDINYNNKGIEVVFYERDSSMNIYTQPAGTRVDIDSMSGAVTISSRNYGIMYNAPPSGVYYSPSHGYLFNS